jgi:O-antigen/teichoic acid export membrane protein
MAIRTSPYQLRFRYDRATARSYVGFSWPLLISSVGGIVVAQGSILAGEKASGLAAAGAITLASSVSLFSNKVDDIVTSTLYPAICAVAERTDLLFESFVKSNRLALMWAMPFGIALGLFAADLVHFVLGDKWHHAIGLLEVTGVIAAVSHIGFNWDDYFRARSNTAPIAVAAVGSTVAMLGAGIPLLLSHGLTGLAIGIGAGAAVQLCFRAWYLSQLFEGFVFVRHAMRAVLPTVPAVAVVLVARQLESGPRTAPMAVAELIGYVALIAVTTWMLEGPLIREAIAYVSRRQAAVASQPS